VFSKFFVSVSFCFAPNVVVDSGRSFYFQGDNIDTLNDWVSHLIRDRFFSVNDERNAYVSMQGEMTGVLDSLAEEVRAAEAAKAQVEAQLSKAVNAKQDAMGVLQNMLVILGVSLCLRQCFVCVCVCVCVSHTTCLFVCLFLSLFASHTLTY
jgi:hypothetical protein